MVESGFKLRHCSSTACAQYPHWAMPLLFKGSGVFCGVNVPSLISSVPVWWAFWCVAVLCQEERYSGALDMPLVNFMSSSPFSADTPSSRVAELGTLLYPLQRLSDFVVAWGCLLPPPSWQYQVYPLWFQLQFFIIRRLNRLSFLTNSWFSSFEWSVFSIACFLK